MAVDLVTYKLESAVNALEPLILMDHLGITHWQADDIVRQLHAKGLSVADVIPWPREDE